MCEQRIAYWAQTLRNRISEYFTVVSRKKVSENLFPIGRISTAGSILRKDSIVVIAQASWGSLHSDVL